MKLTSYISICAAAVLSATLSVQAESPAKTQAGASEWEITLASPAVPTKANASVSRHMETIRKWFANKGLDAQVTRKNEVVKVTIPADKLFAPNSTVLKPEADAVLRNFSQGVSQPGSFKVLIAVYTDDTGDNEYSNSVSIVRAQAVDKALRTLAINSGVSPNIHYYSFGNRNPVKPNNSIENRAKNRRVEIYLVPESKTIDAARAGKLT